MSAYIVNRSLIDALAKYATRRNFNIFPYIEYCGVTFDQKKAIAGNPSGYNDYSDLQQCQIIGRILWMENLRSVAHRYPQDDSSSRPGPVCGNIDATIEGYEFTATHCVRSVFPTALEALAACRELEYQSCETDDYEQSAACKIIQRIKDSAIFALTEDTGTGRLKSYAIDPREAEHRKAAKLLQEAAN